LQRRRIRPGTANLVHEPAMQRHEACRAVLVGAQVAAELVAGGADLLVGGDMGIGNTTPSAAIIGAVTGRAASQVTGRGTGIDDETLARKTAIVDAALARAVTGPAPDPLDLLAEVGGLEIAALAGFHLGAAAAAVPAVLDGVIAVAGACVAARLQPAVVDYLVAGHRSSEPAASAGLDWLGLEPLIDLRLRLGEGSGAALAIPLVQSAAAVMADMATFDAAGVTDKAI
jgi:nicotinate-nucleotide--dimethylbenzimidazole phosphoribosyltransferase